MIERSTKRALSRLGDVFVGVVLVIAGTVMLFGLLLLKHMPPKDPWHAIGVALGATLYAIVAEMFIVLGTEKTMGPNAYFTQLFQKSMLACSVVLVLTAIVIVVCVLIIMW